MCEELLLPLDVLASTSIKRKKSWSRIVWLGQEESESLTLLDPQRISLLYLPQGRTKKNIPKVSPLVAESRHVNTSSNGVYLVGLLREGAIFLWKKEVDTLWLIQGLCQYIDDWETNQDSYSIFVSNDATKILVVASSGHVYVWLLSTSQTESSTKQLNLDGSWYPVDVPIKFRGLFKESDKLSFVSSTFFSNQVLGCCCNCSFMACTKKKLNIITLHLNFLTAALSPTSSFYPFVSDWMSIEYDHLNLSVSDMRGPSVAAYTHDGQILAMAVNMITPNQNKMLFLSPFTNTSVMSSINNCGENTNKLVDISYYWIADMAWTSDDLFLACILRSGSVCIMPRLGEPILLKTSGHSVDMGPARFLPLHPVIIISGITGSPADQPEMNGENSSNIQKFSVSTHPHLPIITYSDGFLVTVLKISQDMTCLSLVCDVILKSSRQLSILSREYSLDLSLATAYQSPPNHEAGTTPQRLFRFEDPGVSLCSQDGELSAAEDENILENIKEGKIVFGIGQSENVDHVLDCSRQRTNPEILKSAYSNLQLAWKLQVTSGCVWGSSKEKAIKQTLQNMTKLFTILLDIPGMFECFIGQQDPGKSGIFCLIRIFRELLDLLRFDFLFQRLVSIIATFVHKTIKLILCNENLAQTDPAIKTLLGCEALLQFSSQSMKKVYTWSPKYLPSAADIGEETESEDNSWYEPLKKNDERLDGKKRSSSGDTDMFCLHELLPTWRLLMKHAKMKAAEIRKVSSDGTDKGSHGSDEKGHTQILVQLFQRLNTRLFSRSSSMQDIKKKPRSISKGDRYSLESMHTLAEDAWKDQLVRMKGSTDTQAKSNILHSLLYTYLLRGQLAKAMEMVETLVVKGDVSAVTTEDVNSSMDSTTPLFFTVIHSSQSSQEQQKAPCIKDPAIRQVVQSLARFMALYFCNEQLFIFPPNSPSPIPVLYKVEHPDLTGRIIPKYQTDITSVITSSGLGDIWTVDRCMEYLLLSGLVPEAAWFSERIGDWKAALITSAAYLKHKAMFPDVYRIKSMEIVLPDHLTPFAILQKKLATLLYLQNGTGTVGTGQDLTREIFDVHDENCLQQLTTTLTSVFTAGVLCDADVVSWLFPALVDSLKELVQSFSANVPVEFHLPAPPYFLWQPTDTIQLGSSGIKTPFLREKECRHSASTLVRLILAVLQSSKLALPLVRWYVLQLHKMHKKVIGKFEADLDGPVTQLPDFLENLGQVKSNLGGLSSNPEVSKMLASFRSFCALLWFLHVRDNLSSHNRQRRAYVENRSIKISKDRDEHWSNLCHQNLIWVVHFLPFSHFLQEERWPYKVLLSLLAEIPSSIHTAQILATHCYNTDQLDPEVQETLEVLLKRWQTITVSNIRGSVDSRQESGFLEEDSPRRKSLSVYFQEYCCTVRNILKQKKKCFGKYSEFLFEAGNPGNEGLIVGSFPFETSESYVKFLDMFFDISFLKLIEEETKAGSKDSVPLIKSFAKKIEKLQMESMPFRTMTGRHPKQNLLILSSPCKNATSPKKPNLESPSFLLRSRSVDQASPVRSRGLFRRSQSADSPRTNQVHSLTPLSAPEKRQMWIASKMKPMEAASPSTRARSSESLSEKNERTLWSFNGQFGPQYFPLNQLVDWMIIWARKNEVLFSQLDKNNKREIKSAIHIEIQPQLLVLALWLIREKYHPPPPSDPRLMSVSFSPHLTEVIAEEKRYESRNARAKMSPACFEEEEPLDTHIPGFDKNQFKKWLRDKLIHGHQENEDEVEQVSFQSSATKSLGHLRKSLVKKGKKKKKKAWDSLHSQDEDRVKQAYEQILQTIDEFSSAAEDLDATNLADVETSERPKTELSSTLLTTGSSVTLSHLTSLSTLTNSVLSESRLSTGSETVDVPPSKSQAASQGMEMKRKKRQTHSVKSDTLSTTKETGDSIVGVNHQESNIQQILQQEIQNMIAIQNERLLSVMGAMLNTDHNSKRQSKKTSMTKTEAQCLPKNVDLENQRPKNKDSSTRTSIHSDRSIENSVHPVPKAETSAETTPHSIGNMRGILKELKNLQISTNAEGTVKSSPTVLKTNQQLRNKRDLTWNGIDHLAENISQDIIPERENLTSNENPEKVYLISNDDSSQRNRLTEIQRLPRESFLSLPQLNGAPLNNESQAQPSVPGCIRIPLLSLNREHNVFDKNRTSASMPEIQFFDYQSHHQSRNLPDQDHPFPQNLTHKTFVNHHNMINSYLQQQPEENHFDLLYFNQKYSSHQQQLPPQDKAPLPLLQIPKENLAPSWPDLQIRLIPPQLIADFKSRILEKDLEKRQHFENFQQNQLKKLEKEEKQVPVPSRRMPLLVAHLEGRKESETDPGELGKNPEISPRKEEPAVGPEKRSHKRKEKAVQNSKQESQDLQEPPPPVQPAESKSLEVVYETPVINEESVPAQIDQGFIMRPGAFDNYLKLGAQLGVPTENYANVQHDLATKLQRLRHESKKVDFSTMTKEMCDASMETDPAMEEQARTAEAATSITKDTGCDPVLEAMMAYNRVVQGSFLSPDIYLQLHSKDPKEEPKQVYEIIEKSTKEKDEGTKHTFLNVVDIPCSAVMSNKAPSVSVNEIVHPRVTATIDSLILPSKSSPEEAQPIPLNPDVNPHVTQAWEDEEEAISAKDSPKLSIPQIQVPSLAPIQDLSPEVLSPPPMPSVTEKSVGLLKSSLKSRNMSEKKEPVRFKFLETYSKSKDLQESSKSSLSRDLRHMDQQIAMIDELALKMEEECHRTKLFSHRMDTLIALEPELGGTPHQDAAVNPEESSQISRLSSHPYRSKPPPSPSDKSQVTQVFVPSTSSAKRPSQQLDQREPIAISVSESKSQILTPHLSTQPPTQRNSSLQVDQNIERIMNLSALSGVSDIIGELIGKGDINLTDVGLMPEEIELLTDKALTRPSNSNSMMQMSVEKLIQMARESEANNNNNSLDQRQELRQWMSHRRNQSHQDYLTKQKEMRAQEKQPFCRKQEPIPNRKMEKELKSRQEGRVERQQENRGRRIAEAEKLILSFKLDQEEAKIRITPPSSPGKSSNVSPKRKKTTSQPSPRPPLQETNFDSTRTITHSVLFREQQKAEDFELEEMRDLELESSEYDFMNIEHPRANIPRPNSQFDPALVYADQSARPPSQEIQKTNPAQRPYKDIVRLQRPEVTRKAPAKDQMPYVERLKEITKKNLQSPRSGDKQKLYGTKKIPTGRVETPVSQREVKTYSERLQEMKKCAKRDESTPIVPQHLRKPPNASKPIASNMSQRIPRRQPVPYVERLRQLSNKGTYTAQDHLPMSTITLKRPPTQRRHTGPPHKPKTYVQQLQAVNAAAKLKQESASHMLKITKERSTSRQHPYANQYSFSDLRSMPDADNMSDISEWALDDRIKDMLYGSQEIEDAYSRRISESGSDYYDDVFSNSARPVEPLHANSTISSEDFSSHIDWVSLEKGLSEQMNGADPQT